MKGGVYLGGYYKPKSATVPTFFVNDELNEWYYVFTISKKGSYTKGSSEVYESSLREMYHAAPTILAFWSEEDET